MLDEDIVVKSSRGLFKASVIVDGKKKKNPALFVIWFEMIIIFVLF